jgi:hypothetical protein
MPHIFRRQALFLLVLLCGVNGPLLAQRPPIPLIQGTQVGKTAFEPGDTPRGGNGQTVDGIEGNSREMLAVHIHAHLSLFLNGEQIAIPCGIGIVKPFRIENGFVGIGSGIYWLHTHDATGIIHIESPDARKYTLGNFFDVWGQPLSARGVAGFAGDVCAYVDGKLYSGDLRSIVFAPHSQITLEVGRRVPSPPVYLFPNGL